MRQSYSDSMNNTLAKIAHTNRDYIDQEIHRLASIQARETDYRRNGMLDFGALQMVYATGESTALIVGLSTASTAVGA